MNRGSLVALAMVAILTTSPLMILDHNQQSHDLIFYPVPVSSSIQSTVSNGSVQYTVYVPQSAFVQDSVRNSLNAIGLYPSVSGSLWTFWLQPSRESFVNETLSMLSEKFGTSFFSTFASPIAVPSIQATGASTSPSIPFAYTPSLISRAYNFTWALSHGINGTGQTIVIIDAFGDPNIAYDIKAFDTVNNLPPVNLQVVPTPYGTPGQYNATWAMETATDVEWAHALAPGAKIILLLATSAYTSSLQQLVSYAVQTKMGNIISLSWGTPETQLGASAIGTYSQVYRQAASEGISVFAASGDNGAYDGTSSLAVNFPASDPYVTAVGGTSLYVLNNNFHQYGWGGVNNGEPYGSGGGYSTFFGTPYWQLTRGYNGTQRGVPDVAMDADRYTGVYVISGGGQYIVGGTSVSTPMWADVAALLRQSSGVSMGSINPLLYQIARTDMYNSSFTQIVSGTNGYYNNSPYWNPVTGLGTPKVSGLINATRNITDGYGGIVLLNGTTSYNSTYVRVSLNTTVNQENLLGNGSTFYYVSLYRNQENYAQFGILASYSGEQLMLRVAQDGNIMTSYFPLPSGYTNTFSNFLMMIQYTGSSISISTSGGFNREIPLFLDYSGEMSPAYGVSQLNASTNLTNITPGTFSTAETFSSGSWHDASYQYFETYSAYGQKNYSTVAATSSTQGVVLGYSNRVHSGRLVGTPAQLPQIGYSMIFGSPIKATFSLHGDVANVSWRFNGTTLPGNSTVIPLAGGVFTVNATYYNSLGLLAYANRTVFFPGTATTNLSLNYTSAGSSGYTSNVKVMWFYNYSIGSRGRIPLIESSNELSVTSPGFYLYVARVSPAPNISVTLLPVPINVTVFTFFENANVTIDGNATGHYGGYHYDNVLPDTNVVIKVSAPGYRWSNFSLPTSPGQNLSLQVTLAPLDSNYSMISGKVTDKLFSFPIENAIVSIDSENASYTNATGYYVLFAANGKYTVNATSELYNPYSTPLNISSNTKLNIQLSPARIDLSNTTPITITHYFPLLFYFGFISWTDYKGGNFSIYQIYISKNQNFLNPTVSTVKSQNTSYRFLTGLVPGDTYYISVVLRLSNNQVYQSQVVKITYNDPLYLGINLILAGAIAFYVFMAYRIFVKKK